MRHPNNLGKKSFSRSFCSQILKSKLPALRKLRYSAINFTLYVFFFKIRPFENIGEAIRCLLEYKMKKLVQNGLISAK